MDLRFVEPSTETQSNELIRYDLTQVPTNVGDNVPEELKPGYKPPPTPEPEDEIANLEYEQELAKCIGESADFDKDCDPN